jgi:hypothetical protein
MHKNYEKTERKQIYKSPIDNLLLAILMQAIDDKDGFIGDHHKNDDGSEATQFLNSIDAKTIYNHLIKAEKHSYRCN